MKKRIFDIKQQVFRTIRLRKPFDPAKEEIVFKNAGPHGSVVRVFTKNNTKST